MAEKKSVVPPTAWSEALTKIPKDIKYVHHGRDINGADCCGLAVVLYRLVGLPIDDLDQPYGEMDYLREVKTRRLVARLKLKFRLVAAMTPADCQNGDLLIMGDVGRNLNHLAIMIDGNIVQMTGVNRIDRGKHHVVGGGFKVMSLHRAWAFVGEVWRHGSLFSEVEIQQKMAA